MLPCAMQSTSTRWIKCSSSVRYGESIIQTFNLSIEHDLNSSTKGHTQKGKRYPHVNRQTRNHIKSIFCHVNIIISSVASLVGDSQFRFPFFQLSFSAICEPWALFQNLHRKSGISTFFWCNLIRLTKLSRCHTLGNALARFVNNCMRNRYNARARRSLNCVESFEFIKQCCWYNGYIVRCSIVFKTKLNGNVVQRQLVQLRLRKSLDNKSCRTAHWLQSQQYGCSESELISDVFAF